VRGCGRGRRLGQRRRTRVPRANIDGLSVAYAQAGAGPALVLLHGFLFDSRSWRPQLDELASDFTVIAWDAPGAGRSSDPPDGFGFVAWAGCLARLLDSAELERAHVVGLSWGGVLAQEFYRRDPDRVISLVLADTYAGWKGSLAATMTEERLAACVRDSTLAADELVSRYLPGMHSESATPEVREALAEIMADFHPCGFRLMARSLADSDTRDILREIRVPTLLVWGEADARSPLQVAHALESLVPGATLSVIPGAGHLSNVEAPARFNAEVRAFCLDSARA
jgi:pimeloyl-ACP methyl ester carboxylesterase